MRKPGFLPVIICVSFELIYHGPILRESINNEFALINKDTIYAWWFQAPDGCTQLRSSKMVENT
jgi:Uma2 family endonuclease